MTKSKLWLGAHTWLAKAERLPQIEATLGYSLRPCFKKKGERNRKIPLMI